MANKDEFKNFVGQNPKLINFVKTGDMSWQKFYELFDLYGAENPVWDEYLTKVEEPKVAAKAAAAGASSLGIGDVMNFLKNVDLNSVQNGVSSLQRVVGVLQDFGKTDGSSKESEYKPRPIYKHFED